MTRIFIENFELDIDKGLSNQITYSVSDLKNIDSKTTAFSKTIILPGTATNNNLLGNIFEFNNANYTNSSSANVGYNFNASKTAKCSIEVDRMTVIKGVFKLLEIIVDGKNVEYECSVIGELGGFSMKLGAKKLEELDFSAYNHTYSYQNIVASWDNYQGGAGYYYPHIDYGLYSTNKHDWDYQTFRPALFVKQYLEKIFAAAGYTYDITWSNGFEVDRFKTLIIPFNKKKLTKSGTQQVGCTPQATTGCIDQAFPMPIQWQNFSGTNWTINGGTTGSVFTYTGLDPTNVTFKVDITFTASTTNTPVNNGIYIDTYKNGVLIPSSTKFIPPFSGTVNDFYIVNLVDEPVVTGDYFEVQASAADTGMCYDSLINQAGSVSISSDIPIILNVNLGDTVSLNDCIPPNILQKDFFASILKLFNLYVDENRFEEKHLIIKPYTSYYDGTVEDWSAKIDRSKPIRIKPMSELNSRYYSFKYKDDSDYWNELYRKRYNEGYGSRIFDSEYEFSKETENVDIIFSPTVLVSITGEDKVYSTIYKFTNSLEERIDSNIRILQARKITGVSSWDLKEGATTLTTLTVYGYAGHFNSPVTVGNDLNFGATRELFYSLAGGLLNQNQFNIYYSPYMAEITDKNSRLLNCNVKLTDTDIFNLSFASFKYIDGGLYRLIKLTDYTPESNETIKAEFLRVINKEY
jgi:hypothetical protein